MRSFDYIRPATIEEATQALGDAPDDALLLAGGTAAVVLMNLGLLRPERVVDIGGVDGLRALSDTDAGLHIGALTTLRALETGGILGARYPLLAEAAGQVGSVRVRNAATVGGSVAYAEPQSDTPVALMALGAAVEVVGQMGRRVVPLESFYRGPYETGLDRDDGEVVAGIDVPAPRERTGGCHMKFTVGPSENKPVANVSVLLELDATGLCADARVVLGAVGPVPLVAERAGALLRGETLDDARVAEAARVASEEADPIEDLRGSEWYKRRIVKVLAERGIRCALQRAAARA